MKTVWFGLLALLALALVACSSGSDTDLDVIANSDLPVDITGQPVPIMATVELRFGGEPRMAVGLAEATNATLAVEARGATSMMVANDPSFMANVATYEFDGGEGIACEQVEEDGVVFDMCTVKGWDLTAGLRQAMDGQLTVYVQFQDAQAYTSPIFSSSVTLDMTPPVVLASGLSAAVVPAGASVQLSATFHEPVDEEAAQLQAFPAFPEGTVVAGPTRVGESLSYVWDVSLPEMADVVESFSFEVIVQDGLGNQSDFQSLLDADGALLTLTLDPHPPELVFAEVSPDQTLFGLPDEGLTLAVAFVLREAIPAAMPGDDGCGDHCPEVHLGDLTLGQVSRAPELDAPVSGDIGFLFETVIISSDWGGLDKQLDISVHWSDQAGNTLTAALVEALRFDFVSPEAVACSLVPSTGNAATLFEYQIVVSEPLASAPSLAVEGPGEGAFADAPEVSENGLVYTWTQAAIGLPSGVYGMSATLTDLAGNQSSGPVCELEFAVDTEPPMVSEIVLETLPAVVDPDGQTLIAVGNGYQLNVSFVVSEGLDPATPPDVYLDAPGSPLTFVLAQSKNLDGGAVHYLYTLEFSAEDHLAAEGLWPVSLKVEDAGGNVTAIDALGGQLVRVDFTPPVAECKLTPNNGDVLVIGDELTFAVTPFEVVSQPPTVVVECFGDCPEPLFEYLPGTAFTYAYQVSAGDATFSASLTVEATDLVGNTSSSACANGPMELLVEIF